MSHKKIITWAKINNLPEVCIAEDDVLFTSLKSWSYFLENKPTDYDLYLGGIYSGISFPDNTVYSFAGLHLYFCHSRFYDKMLSVPHIRNIDQGMAGMGKFVLCNPFVAKQRNGFSFHRKKIVNDDHYLIDKRYKFLTD